MRTPEGINKSDVKDILDSYGDALWYDFPVKFGMGKRVLDVIICFRGLFISLEVKRPGGKGRKFQQRIIEKIRLAGGGALCVDNAAQLRAVLDSIAKLEVRLCGMTPTTT